LLLKDNRTLKTAPDSEKFDIMHMQSQKVAYDKEVTIATRAQTQALPFGDSSLPKLLHEIPERDKPSILFIKGSLPPPDAYIVAVVGSRHPTSNALMNAERIGSALARAGAVVASGLALGCDAAAHKGALRAGGHVIAVLGSGCDDTSLSPKTNLTLAHNVVEHGCLMSEYADGTPPAAWQFPARNRIIAGMSHAVVVVEAAIDSGSLITARLALDYNRDVYALPSPIGSPHGAGTNMLIHEGATIVPSIEMLLLDLEFSPTQPHLTNHPQQQLLQHLSEPQSLDELLQIITIPRVDLMRTLSQLEMEGAVRIQDGKYISQA